MRRLFPAMALALGLVSCSGGNGFDISRVVANPVDIDYAFTHHEGDQFDGMREAADPVVTIYKGRYYLFPSMSFGYWSSDDMQHWKFITNDLMPFENYAPSVMQYKGDLYWCVSGHNKIYKTSDPEDGASWAVASDRFQPFMDDPARTVHDPYLFADDDGKVYLYWGCSTVDPIMGVELDPENGFRAKNRPDTLILHREREFGWECRGDKNETADASSNEGAAMLKKDGVYYLQYAGPGTEFDSYGDGIYTSDSPLGPFEHADYSPFSVKPGGWMTGAGHGDTFQDKYGNWWHAATTVICQRFIFERRIGFYPVIFTPSGEIHALTEFSDYPYILPDRKVDWTRTSPWTGWADLSLGKKVTASSSVGERNPSKACDNTIKTWWSACSGDSGEWLCVDLGLEKTVCAVQTNFADQGFGIGPEPKSPYCFVLECSSDGINWTVLKDVKEGTDNPHSLYVLDKSVRTRLVRLRSTAPVQGLLSVYDLRVFGKGDSPKPGRVHGLKAVRGDDPRRISFSWDASEGADGYILRWGTSRDAMYSTCQVYGTEVELGLFSVGQGYWFSVDAFGEGGVTKGRKVLKVN